MSTTHREPQRPRGSNVPRPPGRSPRIRRPPPTEEEKQSYLDSLRSGWSKSHSAKFASGHDRRRYNELEHEDPAFAAEVEEAMAVGVETGKDEAWRRAVEGVRDFRLDRDGNEHELVVYSDKLLELELKRRDFAYRERMGLEITGAGGGPIEFQGRVEHDFYGIFATLEQAGVVTGGPTAAATLAKIDALLPARADDEAVGGADSTPLPPG